MPRSLKSRIVLAFTAITLATLVALGSTLFVVLRGLHHDATLSALADVGQSLMLQTRPAALTNRDLRSVLSDLRDQVAARGFGVHLVLANGAVLNLGDSGPAVDSLSLDPSLGRGQVQQGEVQSSVGAQLYAATILRSADQVGPRALVVSAPDRSGALALTDLLRTLPLVVLASIVVGGPLTWLLSRSVTAPLRRLAAATADMPRANPAAVPLEGPTEIQELTSRFNAMSAELAETRQHEMDLLANLRHDLRTPLTVIGGFATALADGTATGDDVGRAARAIREEADRLERLVAELGAVELSQGGAPNLRPGRLDAREVLQAAVDRFAGTASGQGAELVLLEPIAPASPPSEDGLSLVADRLAVDRILGNLVGNALAAVPSGGHVWLQASPAASTTLGTEAVSLTVTDDGPGFPPGAAEHVFERFYRADPARSGPGSGLGMSIVRDLARAHGGTVYAENVAPHGARVTVTLPRVPRPDANPKP